ncbi:MAG: hypothetical protein RR630_01125 [Coprobacillus sp.]
MCKECYSDNSRITPLLKPLECLYNHTQYICGTCGRYICIEHDPKRGLQRWNFPFQSLSIAKLYLRTADYTLKVACGIYEIKDMNGRISYKIFKDNQDLIIYLNKHKNKTCEQMQPLFSMNTYQDFPHTQVRKLTKDEINQYMLERKNAKD